MVLPKNGARTTPAINKERNKAARSESRTEADRRRVQIDLTPAALEHLQGFREEWGARTYAELFRDAIRFLEWHHKQRKDGYRMQLVKGDVVREVEVIF